MNITLAENQNFYLGEDIQVTIKAIYRQKDGKRYVQLDVQVPKTMLIFRDEKLALNAQTTNDDFKKFNNLQDNIGNRGMSPYAKFNLKGEVLEKKEDRYDFSKRLSMETKNPLNAAKISEQVRLSWDVKETNEFCHTGEKS